MKALHIQKKHKKAPRHWRPTSSHLHRTLGWSRLPPAWGGMEIQGWVLPLLLSCSIRHLSLTAPSLLPSRHCRPQHSFAGPPSQPPAMSSLLAQGTSSLSRARSTGFCLQKKPLPESWREISKRVMLVRVTSRFLARKVRSDVCVQGKRKQRLHLLSTSGSGNSALSGKDVAAHGAGYSS